MKRVLMIAYHFPPLAGSSGIQRTLRFARYLPEFGWHPIVLTAHPRAYLHVSDDQLVVIPPGVEVIRAPAWDTSRHFAVAGRYPAMLARPDRWISWWLGAVWKGMSAIRRLQPAAIWSTYPIATAHLIGATLARRSGLPWIADFRDPMAQPGYPPDPAIWKSFEKIEREAATHACCATFTTPSAVKVYRERYPKNADGMILLENGYDEETFTEATLVEPLNPGRLTLLHSGIVYPSERDPTQLFEALSYLKETHPDLFARVVIRFRSPVHDVMLKDFAQHYNVVEAIEIKPPVSYLDALHEMLCADGLLILQAANCNAQIPAKLYEYLRAGQPVLALTDPVGDTAHVVRRAGIEAIAPLDDAQAIASVLAQFVEKPGDHTLPSVAAVAAASRRERTRQLSGILDLAAGGMQTR